MTRPAARILLALACGLVLVGSALGATPKGKTVAKDGTLVVSDGAGVVTLNARGSVLVRVAGTIRVRDLDETDGQGPVLVGCTVHDVSGETADDDDQVLVCSGDDVRLRILKDSFRLRVSGRAMSISAIGIGNGTLRADPNVDNPGTYALDDSDPLPLPSLVTKYRLGRTATSAAVVTANVAS